MIKYIYNIGGVHMSYISDLRESRKVKAYSKKNDKIFNEYLQTELSPEELSGVMGMIDHPEIYSPLMNNVDLLLTQPNFNEEMQATLLDKATSMRGEGHQSMIDKITASMPGQAKPATKNSLKVSAYDIPLKDKIAMKIHQTYNSINDEVNTRLDATKDRIKQPFIKMKDVVTEFGSKKVAQAKDLGEGIRIATMPAVGMVADKARERMNLFKEDYNGRKLSLQNDKNLATALAAGVSETQISEGIEFMHIPEVRFAMVNNIDSLLSQGAMTPELADELYDAALPYLSQAPNSRQTKAFVEAFETYDARAVEDVHTTDIRPVVENEEESIPNDVKQATMVVEDDHEAWEVPTVEGSEVIPSAELEALLSEQYPNEQVVTKEFIEPVETQTHMGEYTPDEFLDFDGLEEPPAIEHDDDYFNSLGAAMDGMVPPEDNYAY